MNFPPHNGYCPEPYYLAGASPTVFKREPLHVPVQHYQHASHREDDLMRYHALACDYDGTIARHGQVDEDTVAALERARRSGRKLLLVTGRELEDLQQSFARLDLFALVVAENGALLYDPATRQEKPLGERPPQAFIDRLREQGVTPLSVGRVIIATWEPQETAVLETIRDLGLELQVIFNKGAVMVLPAGLNKASGLATALRELGLSPHNTVAVGDAENDHAFLSSCECAVAVANALPMLKERADWVTEKDHGAGVAELIEKLVSSDLRELEPRLERHAIRLGTRADGQAVRFKPYGLSVLITGTSGSGKSTLATGILERLTEQGYQYCIIDPEGDYEHFGNAVVLGDVQRAPNVEEVIEILAKPEQNGIVNLLGIPMADRPAFFANLFLRIQALRACTGRPHWVVIDEAHHLLPASWEPAAVMLPQELHGVMLITVHPDHLSQAILSSVDLNLIIGSHPERTLNKLGATPDEAAPSVAATQPLNPGEAIAWSRREHSEPVWFQSIPPRTERRRHVRKYAQGALGPDKSFYFRGPEGKLNLRVQSLMLFMQIAEGVDEETWLFHLRQQDYSQWFRQAIKDNELAAEAERIEKMETLSPEESRAQLKQAIEKRYTAPA